MSHPWNNLGEFCQLGQRSNPQWNASMSNMPYNHSSAQYRGPRFGPVYQNLEPSEFQIGFDRSRPPPPIFHNMPPPNGNPPMCPPGTWLQNWLKKTEDIPKTSTFKVQSLSISEIQKKLSEYLTIVEILNTKLQALQTAGDENISDILVEIKDLEAQISPLLGQMQDPLYIAAVKDTIESRRKQRQRSRAKKADRKIKKKKIEQDRQKKHAAIDKWRQGILNEEKRKQQEQTMKKEADTILSEVKSKQNCTRQMKSLLHSLSTLRDIRKKKAENNGIVTCDKGYNTLNSKICDLIGEQESHYQLEETTLRVMMQESPNASHQAIKTSNVDLQKLQQQIYEIYFGKPSKSNSSDFIIAEASFEELINSRIEWDKFLTADVMSCSVPLGLVLPPVSPSDQYKPYQLKDIACSHNAE